MLTAPATPGLRLDPAASVCHHVLGLYEQLRVQDSLAPSSTVDALFGDLVHTCVQTANVDATAVLADPRIRTARPGLVRLCAQGESLLERHWAEAVLLADDAQAQIATFPYFDNYDQLTRLETHALAGAGHRPGTASRICFVGGGPLPLSAVLLCRCLEVDIRVVDRDAEAVELSTRLVQRLAPAGRIRVVSADAALAADLAPALAGCDVVVLAALVGLTRGQKQAILRTLGTVVDPGTYLVARTADGLRSLLYPTIDVHDVSDAGFTPEVLVHPLGEVVNSVLVARRR